MPRYILKKNNRNEMQIYDTTEQIWTTKLLSDIRRMNKIENESQSVTKKKRKKRRAK
jgi:hypothetical protein